MYPKLQAFTVELSRVTPSGDVLFAGHADSDSDSASDSDGHGDEHPVRLYRKRIDPELFDPFVAAFSRALHRMPAIGHGHLLMGCSESRLPAGVEVLAVGAGANGIWDHPAEEAARNRMRATIRWRNSWVVPADVRELWEQWVGEGGTLRINGWDGAVWYKEQNAMNASTEFPTR